MMSAILSSAAQVALSVAKAIGALKVGAASRGIGAAAVDARGGPAGGVVPPAPAHASVRTHRGVECRVEAMAIAATGDAVAVNRSSREAFSLFPARPAVTVVG